MNAKVKAFWEKLKGILKGISKKVYIAIATVLVLVVAVIAVMIANTDPYAVLFTGLNSSETSSILTYLKEQGVLDYKVENNDTILVPVAQENQLRAQLLMEGYPQSGFSYSYDTYYKNIGALSTESERKKIELDDLQDQMSAVVRCFENVKNATVKINAGEDQTFVLDSAKTLGASASVVVEMDGTTRLTSDQAMAIRNFIAHGVKGLEVDQVYISDTIGNQYTTADSTADADASALKIQLEQEWENKMRSEVMHVLRPFFGEQNVAVAVDVIVDISQTVQDATEVSLPEYAQDGSTDGKGIFAARIYEHSVTRPADEVAGGVVGTESNSDLSEYVEDLQEVDDNNVEIYTSGQDEYDNNRSETHTIRTAGYITDCSISVSLNSTGVENIDLQSLRVHVARAACASLKGTVNENTGLEYLEDCISIVAMPFYVAPDEPGAGDNLENKLPVSEWVLYAAIAGIVLFFILLIVIIVVLNKRKKKRKLAAQQSMAEQMLAAAGLSPVENVRERVEEEPVGAANVMALKTERSMELRKDIRQFTDDNPEIAAQIIRSWLKGGEG